MSMHRFGITLLAAFLMVGCSDDGASAAGMDTDTQRSSDVKEPHADCEPERDSPDDSDRESDDADRQWVTCGEPDEQLRADELEATPGCEVALGRLFFVHYFEERLRGTHSLVRAEKGISISRAPLLKTVEDLSNLEYIGLNLGIQGPSEITNLNGLEQLETIEGELLVRIHDHLTSLSGLKNLESVGGDVTLTSLPSLTTLDDLESLQYIGGDLSIGLENVSKDEVLSFMDRVEIEGTVIYNTEEL